MGCDQSLKNKMRKQMTSAELGYQQKELEMLINILKEKRAGVDFPDRPGFEIDGLPKTIFDLIKQIK